MYRQAFRGLPVCTLRHVRFFASKKGGSSHRYLERQRRDRFVQQAHEENYRARSSYKLLEMISKHSLLPKDSSSCIVDCGASPGGWSQVVGKKAPGRVISVDLLPMLPIPGVRFIHGDFLESDVKKQIVNALDGRRVGLVLSDMAPSFTGHHSTDAARTMNLCEDVLAFSSEFLDAGGSMVLKFFMGGGEDELRKELRRLFAKVLVQKPEASRRQSSEQYLICKSKLQ